MDTDAGQARQFCSPVLARLRMRARARACVLRCTAGAHSDYGMLTLLATDAVPGLQIHRGEAEAGAGGREAPAGTSSGSGSAAAAAPGRWVDVCPKPGTFIINLGDMLERWTNGRYRSTLHRVVNTTGQERYSIAFFFGKPGGGDAPHCVQSANEMSREQGPRAAPAHTA